MNIATIQGAAINLDIVDGKEVVSFLADMDIDCDGTGGNPFGDPYFQPDTRYHYQGKPLHAETVPYVVVPPIVLAKTKGRVLGSLCEVTNIKSGQTARAIVGDSGPTRKIGEGSPALASLLGLDPNPNHGGTDKPIILYKIHVGLPAIIDGVNYTLQSA